MCPGKQRAEHREFVADAQDSIQRLHVIQGIGGAKLDAETVAVLVGCGLEKMLNAGRQVVLELMCGSLCPVRISVEQRIVDPHRKGLRIIGHQRVVDPEPDRFKCGPRNPAAVPVFGAVVDQKRFKRLEEQMCVAVELRGPAAAFAKAAAQFGEHHLRPCRAGATQLLALKLRDQQSTRPRFELPEV